jgi:acetoin utilization deacetylase AcuC-like enzyme
MRTGLVIDERYERHDTGPGHPERPERIRMLRRLVDDYRRDDLVRLEPRLATTDELALVHDPRHIALVASSAAHEFAAFDADTRVSAASWETARLAAGGALAVADAVAAGDVDNGFAFVRPPGHHAEQDRAMGFCLFNNVAIAARHLQRAHGLERVLIVDWDVHHGNGTQHAFWDDPSVLYASTHQYPFYPGTGAASEVGEGEGAGRTVNVPLPSGAGDDELMAAFTTLLVPIADQFRPDVVLISAGFDAHRRDPLAGLAATEAGFRALTRVLLGVARRHAQGRLVAVLEGGYDLEALRATVPEVLDELGGRHLDEPLATPQPYARVLDAAVAAQRAYWDL